MENFILTYTKCNVNFTGGVKSTLSFDRRNFFAINNITSINIQIVTPP